MNRIVTLVATLLLVASELTYAQFFEWAGNDKALHGAYVSDLATDQSGNMFIAGQKVPVQSYSTFFVSKTNTSGVVQWSWSQYSSAGGAAAYAIATDYAGNSYVIGGVYNTNYIITFDSIHSIKAKNFLIKFSPAGNVLWMDSLEVNTQVGNDWSITADSSGATYISNGSKTFKYNSSGMLMWKNTQYGGVDLALDKYGSVYLLNSNSLIKLNSAGQVKWVKPYGGKKLAADAAGNCYIVSDDSVYKCNNKGTVVWSNVSLQVNNIALDATGKIFLVSDTKVYRLDKKGHVVLWTLLMENTEAGFIASDGQHCFIAGAYNSFYETMIGQFHFTRSSQFDYMDRERIFKTMINLTDSIPFQANIYVPAYTLHQRLCSGDTFYVNFKLSLNSVSSFGPANQFRAELRDPATGNFIDIGPAGTAFIPLTFPESNFYQVRVVSTDPVVIGDVNSPSQYSDYLVVKHLPATITPAGNISICDGSSIQLHAKQSPNTFSYKWYKDQVLVGTDTVLTVSNAGNYTVRVHDGLCGLTSPLSQVTVNPLPDNSVSASGPLTFCNGDSVVLAVPQAAGNIYHWKKNNTTIPGANSYSYAAKNSGAYKVKITSQDGCTATSSNQFVVVNCRESSGELTGITVFPQPFTSSFTVNVTDGPVLKLNLFDQTGRKVAGIENALNQPWQSGISLQTGHLQAGVYFLELLTPSGYRRTKIMKL